MGRTPGRSHKVTAGLSGARATSATSRKISANAPGLGRGLQCGGALARVAASRRVGRDADDRVGERAGVRRGTGVPLPGAARATISGAPPASVTTTGAPLASASTTTIPYGSGSVDGSTKRSRSANSSGVSVARTEPVDAGLVSSARREVDRRAAPCPRTGAPATTRCSVGPRPLALLERVEQHVEALPRVDAPDRADERRIVRDADAAPEPPGSSGRNSAGSTVSYTTSTFAPVELVGDRLRHADHLDGEVPARKRSSRSAAPDCTTISRACQTCGRRARRRRGPAVQRVERVRVHDVDVEAPDQPGETRRPRPASPRRSRPNRGRRGSSTAGCIGTECSVGAGGGELGRQRRADRAARRGSRTRRVAGCAASAGAPDPIRLARRPVGRRAAGSCASP